MARGLGGNLSIVELEAELNRRRKAVARLERRRATVQRRLDALDAEIARLGGPGRGSHRGGRARNERSLADMIHDVLQKGASRVGDIMIAVQKAGYRSSSPNFRSIVNQVLIKDRRFTAAERGVYQLRKGA